MAIVAPIGLWLKCPRCSHEVEGRQIFAKADLVKVRPGVVTCSNCGAHFTYTLRSFRVCIGGLFVSALLCAWLPLAQYYLSAVQFNVMLAFALSVLLFGLGTLWFAGLQVVDNAKR